MQHFKEPTQEETEYVHSQLNNPEAVKYFFSGLKNPLWIPELQRLGWFQIPPTAKRDSETGGISHPDWPPLEYLVRMAEISPSEVHGVLSSLEESDNMSVRIGVIEAASRLPTPYSKDIAINKIKLWISEKKTTWFCHNEQLPQLVTHLADGKEKDAAFELAEALLAVHREDVLGAMEQFSPDLERSTIGLEAKGLVDDYEYGKWLHRIVSDLASLDVNDTVSMLVRLLMQANECSFWPSRSDFPDDHSSGWRPAIKDHEQNWGHNLRNAIVVALRDLALQIAEKSPDQVPTIVRTFEQGGWTVFKRLTLFILRSSLKYHLDMATDRLLDMSNFDNVGIRHEYSALLCDAFPLLTQGQRDSILKRIEDGPTTEHLVKGISFSTGKPYTPEEITQYVREWQRDRLSTISKHLHNEWLLRYEELIKELGEAQHADFPSYHWKSGPFGPSSPFTPDELYQMPHDELVHALKNWSEKSEDPYERQRDLAIAVRSTVSSHPEHFSVALDHFKTVPKVHVYFILGGFEQAVRDGKPIEWPAIINFCDWVVSLDDAAFNDSPKENPHNLRRDARGEVADLIGHGLSGDHIQNGFRDRVWGVLSSLAVDGFEQGTVDHVNDPYSYAINSTPGKVLNAIVRYALWVYRTLDNPENGLFSSSLQEVGRVLEFYLHPNAKAHPATHSVLGQWLPWLVLMDKAWTRSNLEGILPPHDEGRDFREAAWRTFILYDSAYSDVFRFLESEYMNAIDSLPTRENLADEQDNYATQLVDHIAIFYLRGLIDLQDPDGCLQRLYSKQRPDLNAQVMSFIGQSLSRSKQAWEAEPLQRANEIWLYRLAEAERAEDKKFYAEEIADFGWWYQSPQLEPEWATRQLILAIRIAGFIEDEHDIFKRFTDLIHTQPETVLDGLTALVEYDKRGWYGYLISKVGADVVKIALESGIIGQYDKASHLVEVLCAKGYFEARAWLQS